MTFKRRYPILHGIDPCSQAIGTVRSAWRAVQCVKCSEKGCGHGLAGQLSRLQDRDDHPVERLPARAGLLAHKRQAQQVADVSVLGLQLSE